jgi:hypothetical protein
MNNSQTFLKATKEKPSQSYSEGAIKTQRMLKSHNSRPDRCG